MAATPLEYYDPNPSPTPSPASGTGSADPTVGFGLTARHDDPDHGPSISEMHAVIEDGLLMVFGPEGDPVPPQSFAEMAAREPRALVAMAGVGGVPVARVIDVLEAPHFATRDIKVAALTALGMTPLALADSSAAPTA